MQEREFEIELQKHHEQIAELAAHLCISFEEAKQGIINCGKMIGVIVDNALSVWDSLVEFVKEIDFEELDSKHKRELHKLDFTRPRIQHQVICRKPRNLIKKIIH